MISETLLFFAQYGIFLIIILSLLNFRNEAKSLVSLGLAVAVSYAISFCFYSPPPFVQGGFEPLIPHGPSSSFPSHHASAGFALSASTFNTNTALGLISSAVAVLMSIGRVYAGIHSKIDIVGGLLIGAFCAIFAYSKFADNLAKKLKDEIKYYGQKKAAHKVVPANIKKRGQKPKRA